MYEHPCNVNDPVSSAARMMPFKNPLNRIFTVLSLPCLFSGNTIRSRGFTSALANDFPGFPVVKDAAACPSKNRMIISYCLRIDRNKCLMDMEIPWLWEFSCFPDLTGFVYSELEVIDGAQKKETRNIRR
jgi:hypothetical protein